MSTGAGIPRSSHVAGWLAVLIGSGGAAAELPESPAIVFRQVAEPSGVSFRFEAGSRGRHDLPEVMGGASR